MKNKTQDTDNLEDLEFTDEFEPNYYCNICCTLKLDNPFHCDSCNLCIDKHDHHCPWIGKVYITSVLEGLT